MIVSCLTFKNVSPHDIRMNIHETYYRTVTKMGNANGVSIPAPIMKDLKVNIGDDVRITKTNNGMMIEFLGRLPRYNSRLLRIIDNDTNVMPVFSSVEDHESLRFELIKEWHEGDERSLLYLDHDVNDYLLFMQFKNGRWIGEHVSRDGGNLVKKASFIKDVITIVKEKRSK